MLSETPDPHHWTLRFKKHKTTIVLFVDESQSFTSIKADLLEAIKATGIDEINGNKLPINPDDIVLGVPVDRIDLTKGWVDLEIPEKEDDEQSGSKPKGVKKNSVLNASPLGAGLRDGAVLAFKFVSEDDKDESDTNGGDWDVIIPSYEEEDESQVEA